MQQQLHGAGVAALSHAQALVLRRCENMERRDALYLCSPDAAEASETFVPSSSYSPLFSSLDVFAAVLVVLLFPQFNPKSSLT